MVEVLEHRGLGHLGLWCATDYGLLDPGVDRHIRDATRAAHRVDERSPQTRPARDVVTPRSSQRGSAIR